MPEEILWRFLVVDDRQADEIEELVAEHKILEPPERVIVKKCTQFDEALGCLNETRVDLIILDVRDDSIALPDEEIPQAGEKVFYGICKTRFIPVVFYTAIPRRVENFKSPYVRVVARNPRALRAAIAEIFETGLPRLNRFLEDEQRTFMWDHVQELWKSAASSYEKTDLVYVLARRLANRLERKSIRHFLTSEGVVGPQEGEQTVHPIEMYVYPPADPELLAGDILRGTFKDRDGFWIILTPSCDIAHKKAARIILAACVFLKDQPEYNSLREHMPEAANSKKKKQAKEYIENLIGNNRKGDHIQPERYYYLPETFFLPDLVIDFQDLVSIFPEEIKLDNRVASLDSPFAEACLARFSRYYGRLGTPDIDRNYVCEKIMESMRAEIEKQEI